jgi:hypothetical protein
MSNLETIGLILATLVGGGGLLIWLSELLNRRAAIILTGLSDGVPISLEQRRLMLYRVYFQYLGSIVGISLVLTLALVRIAENVGDPDIQGLAYVTAFLTVFSGITWATLGTWTGNDCVRELRKAAE